MMHTGGVNSPVPGAAIPHIAAELMLNFDGGAGGVDDGVPEAGGKIWTCEHLPVKVQRKLVE
jgi:hypothetical protein